MDVKNSTSPNEQSNLFKYKRILDEIYVEKY